MKERRYDLLFIALAFFGLAVVVASSGCGSSELQRRIDTADKALTKAENTFIEWDEGHQLRLVETTEEGQEEVALERYRRRRDQVLLAFSEAWTALEAAAADPKPSRWVLAGEKAGAVLKLLAEIRR